MKQIYVTAPPPTPNGDLHVGHLAGPYLAADIYSRYQKLLGNRVAYITFGDDHQSYVATTAHKKNIKPEELVKKCNNTVKSTFRLANIEVDLYKKPLNNNKHALSILTFFLELYHKGKLKKKTTDILYCSKCDIALYESFVKGTCPFCKNESAGNVCEACGKINDPVYLENASCSICYSKPTSKQYTGLFFPINDYREELANFYSSRKTWRPQLIEFCKEMVSKKIPDYPVTYPSSWGINVPLPEFKDQVINAWFEMYPGTLESIGSHSRYKYGFSGKPEKTQLVQFLGFDNSFFNSILHVAIAFALEKRELIPENIITNYFYLLDKEKFSTSREHAIWAGEILKDVPADNLRFYLSLTNPEHMQTNFSLDEFIYKNEKFEVEWEKTINKYMDIVKSDFKGIVPFDYKINYQASSLLQMTKINLEKYYDLEQFSLRKASREILNYMNSITDHLESKVIPMKNKDPFLYSKGIGNVGYLLKGLAIVSSPIMPTFSKKLIRNLGIKEKKLRWIDISNKIENSDIGNERRWFLPINY